MDKFLYLISEGLKNVWRHKMTTFTAVFSLFLALYFVGLLATAGENTKSILQYLRSKYKIEVFFKQNRQFGAIRCTNKNEVIALQTGCPAGAV